MVSTAGTLTTARLTATRLATAARAVADAEPDRVEAAVVALGRSRRYLAPLAWAGGTIVLVVRGAALLASNWRLCLVELLPAGWVWFVMWDLTRHGLRSVPLQDPDPVRAAAAVALVVIATVVAFWANTLFGFAITHSPPRLRPAWGQARASAVEIVAAGVVGGLLLASGLAGVPRIESDRLHLAAVVGMYGLLLVSLVLVPARILGVGRHRLPPRQAVGRWVTGVALSALAMSPGLVLDRLGVLLLAVPGLRLVGAVLLTVGVALYAAGLSSVKAIKLSMRLGVTGADRDG